MQYFARLRAAHQNHYEQFGRVTGSVEVDGEESRLEIQVSRESVEREHCEDCSAPGDEGPHARLHPGLEADAPLLLPPVHHRQVLVAECQVSLYSTMSLISPAECEGSWAW